MYVREEGGAAAVQAGVGGLVVAALSGVSPPGAGHFPAAGL